MRSKTVLGEKHLRLLAVGGDRRAKTFGLQIVADEFGECGLVLDNQDVGGGVFHRSNPITPCE